MKKSISDLIADCYQTPFAPAIVEVKSLWAAKLASARRVVDVGGMWGCNGLYSFVAASEGAKQVVLIDHFATERFDAVKRRFANVEYAEMNIYEAMRTGALKDFGARRPAQAALCYDLLLHIPDPVHFVSHLVEAFSLEKAIFANPVAADSASRSDLLFVPFSKGFQTDEKEILASTGIRDQSGWVWIFSHGFLLNCMKYVGLRVVEEALLPDWHAKRGLGYSLIMVSR